MKGASTWKGVAQNHEGAIEIPRGPRKRDDAFRFVDALDGNHVVAPEAVEIAVEDIDFALGGLGPMPRKRARPVAERVGCRARPAPRPSPSRRGRDAGGRGWASGSGTAACRRPKAGGTSTCRPCSPADRRRRFGPYKVASRSSFARRSRWASRRDRPCRPPAPRRCRRPSGRSPAYRRGSIFRRGP